MYSKIIELEAANTILSWSAGSARNFDVTLPKGSGRPWHVLGVKFSLSKSADNWTISAGTFEADHASSPADKYYRFRDAGGDIITVTSSSTGYGWAYFMSGDADSGKVLVPDREITLRMQITPVTSATSVTDGYGAFLLAQEQ